MRTTEELKKIVEQLKTLKTREERQEVLKQLTNEEQFQLDVYISFGELTSDGVACFPFRVIQGEKTFMNDQPRKNASWIPMRYVNINDKETLFSMELISGNDNYKVVNVLKPNSASHYDKDVLDVVDIFFDIDYGHKDMPDEERQQGLTIIYNRLKEAFDNGEVPYPTSWLFSGRGFSIHYKIQAFPTTDLDAMANYAALYQCGFDRFSYILGDRDLVDTHVSNSSRLARVAGSWNSKGRCSARFIDQTVQEYTLNQLIESNLIDNREDFETRVLLKKQNKSITHNAMKRYYARLSKQKAKKYKSAIQKQNITHAKKQRKSSKKAIDISTEDEKKQWGWVAKYGLMHLDEFVKTRIWVDGSGRYNLCLIYYSLLRTLYRSDEAEERLRNLAESFEEPLGDEAIDRCINGIETMIWEEGHPLRYTFETIVQQLKIPEYVAEQCGFRNQELAEKKATLKKESDSRRNIKIIELYQEGLTQSDIAKQISQIDQTWKTSERTVRRVIAAYKAGELDDNGRSTIEKRYTGRKSTKSGQISSIEDKNKEKWESKPDTEVLTDDGVDEELAKTCDVTIEEDDTFREFILETLLLKGRNCFLHGEGGVGKTHLVKEYVSRCEEKGLKVTILCPTGIATTNYVADSITINSFFQLPAGIVEETMIGEKQIAKLKDVDVICIDECSMIRCDYMQVILYAVKKANEKYHKSITLLLLGDMLQLQPVVRECDKQILYERYKSNHFMFFESECFKELELTHVLLERNRRTLPGAEQYAKLLSLLRTGDVRTLRYFNTRVVSDILVPPEGIIAIAGTNAIVDSINCVAVKKHEQDESFTILKATGTDTTNADEYPVDITIPVFIGARVMLKINNKKKGYVNGMLGSIVEIGDGYLSMKTSDGKLIRVTPERIPSEKDDTKYITQFPLSLAYAITIHKSQGLSFHQAFIYPKSFAASQLYVALSRLRSMDGLYLAEPIKTSDLIVNKEAQTYLDSLHMITAQNYMKT